jgi:putative tryptophan/tyrosine transport system substrate-binding protein
MDRRGFIASVAGGLLVAPLTVNAQQLGKLSRIGYLGTSTPVLDRHLIGAFRRELGDLGYTEGENIVIEYRWAEGHDDRLPALAADLVNHKPDVIVTSGTPGTLAVKQATTTIPIVMTSSGNPVEVGLVASLAHPGGNVTGLSILAPELEGKRLELLQQAVPSLSHLGVLWNSGNPAVKTVFEETQVIAARMRMTLEPVVEVRQINEFESAFTRIIRARPDALVVLVDRFLLAQRTRIVKFVAEQRLPAMYPYREYVDAGGFLSYAPSNIALYRGAAIYVDKLLKGARAAELPIEQPTTFELVINLKTAKALGLAIPQSLLLRADDVIR